MFTKNLARLIPKRSLSLNVEKAFKDKVYDLHQLAEGPSEVIELKKDDALQYFKAMDEMRKLENAVGQLYREKMIRGFCHLYVGQEAVAVGINSILRPQDTVITAYRCHGWAMLKCNDNVGIVAELLGFESGVARGKGGSMHMYSPNFFGGNGIVGAHVPLGTGIALKHKYLNEDAVCVTLYGDGAANQGQVFEAFNIAKLLNLPVMFVIENNHYGLGTASERSSANPNYYQSCSFIPGVRASGMDLLSVIQSAKFCMKHILDGKGPILLEMVTYRYFGHSMSDPGTSYRDRDEVQKVRAQKDCIQAFKKIVLDSKLLTPEEVKATEKENRKKVEADVKKALSGSPVPLEELIADAYKSYSDQLKLPQMLKWVPHKNIAKWPEAKT